MKPVKHHTVLWADDDADDLHFVREVIERLDNKHQLKEATNGRQALDYLYSIKCTTQLPCLVVLDINMPLLNGKETLAIIKSEERYSHIHVVVFTTSNSEKDRQFCERFGVKMYTKPHSYYEFEKLVGQLLSLCDTPDAERSALN